MTNGTMKKARARAKKGVAVAGNEVNLKADKKDEVTGIPSDCTDAGPGPIEENVDADKASESVELVFGINAGITWESLNLMGPMAVDDLVKETALLPEEIYGALGWLGRENKISVERRGTERVYSLRS